MEIGIALKNELEIQISEAFCTFDQHGDKYIDTQNVGNVLRFLGCVPSIKEINEIIKATESPENTGEIHLTMFLAHICPMLMDRKMQPASSTKLLKAFESLDPENKRFITKEYFEKLMSEEGEKFSERELNLMWPMALDPITDNVPYIFYIGKLKHISPIYDVAQAVKDDMAAAEKDKEKKRSPRINLS